MEVVSPPDFATMAMTFDPWLAALVTTLTVVAVVSLNQRRRSFPPGPKGLPIVGNIFDVPKEFEWLAYDRWSRECRTLIANFSRGID